MPVQCKREARPLTPPLVRVGRVRPQSAHPGSPFRERVPSPSSPETLTYVADPRTSRGTVSPRSPALSAVRRPGKGTPTGISPRDPIFPPPGPRMATGGTLETLQQLAAGRTPPGRSRSPGRETWAGRSPVRPQSARLQPASLGPVEESSLDQTPVPVVGQNAPLHTRSGSPGHYPMREALESLACLDTIDLSDVDTIGYVDQASLPGPLTLTIPSVVRPQSAGLLARADGGRVARESGFDLYRVPSMEPQGWGHEPADWASPIKMGEGEPPASRPTSPPPTPPPAPPPPPPAREEAIHEPEASGRDRREGKGKSTDTLGTVEEEPAASSQPPALDLLTATRGSRSEVGQRGYRVTPLSKSYYHAGLLPRRTKGGKATLDPAKAAILAELQRDRMPRWNAKP